MFAQSSWGRVLSTANLSSPLLFFFFCYHEGKMQYFFELMSTQYFTFGWIFKILQKNSFFSRYIFFITMFEVICINHAKLYEISGSLHRNILNYRTRSTDQVYCRGRHAGREGASVIRCEKFATGRRDGDITLIFINLSCGFLKITSSDVILVTGVGC